jgi:hypothetical protein
VPGAIRRCLDLVLASLGLVLVAAASWASPSGASAAPALQVSFAQLTSVPPRAGVILVPGHSAVSGRGPVRRFAVEVERGLRVNPEAFAASVQRILLDRRGWTGAGRLALQRVDSGVVDLRVTLARPRTVDRLCFPLHTAGVVDCFNRGRAVINVDRWTRGSVSYVGDLRDYRYYLINHEVGHGLGHGHWICPGPGRRAFVMMQQTGTTFGCHRQPWPRAAERRHALIPPRVLVLGGARSAQVGVRFLRMLGAPNRRLAVRVAAAPRSRRARALRGVAAVVVLDGAGVPTSGAARRALLRYVRAGGGLLAVGSATDRVPRWRGWSHMLGTAGAGPPFPAGSLLTVDDPREPPTRLLPPSFTSAEPLAPPTAPVHAHVLASVATGPGAGAQPVAWCRREREGRVFADALGSSAQGWAAGTQQALVAGGLAWTLGLAEGSRCR